MIEIDLHLIHLQEGSLSSIFFPQNTTYAHFIKGKSTVDAPFFRKKSAFGDLSMKGKSIDLPKEGKKVETTSISINFSREKFRD